MSWFVKKALAKKLSPFFKGMSSDDFSLSFLKGSGGVKDMELNTEYLQELLQLPPWLTFDSAMCSHMSLKIPWTKLSSRPVKVVLGVITVKASIDPSKQEVVTAQVQDESEMPQSPVKKGSPKKQMKKSGGSSSDVMKYGIGGKYGMIDAIIDGVQVDIQAVNIVLSGPFFCAKISVSDLNIFSATPEWECTKHLKQTRVRDKAAGVINLYKALQIGAIDMVLSVPEHDQSERIAPFSFSLGYPMIRCHMKKPLIDTSKVCSPIFRFTDSLFTGPRVITPTVRFYLKQLVALIKPTSLLSPCVRF
eukprot:m.10859 g.10859  ORF g.10859 m.10859 type:complete len:305 (+) comp5627_c0_seq2:110-1024(+)